MNRDYNGVVKRKARRWWIAGGVAIVGIACFIWVQGLMRPYRFLHGSEFYGYEIGQFKDGSGIEWTITEYVVPRDASQVTREAENELLKPGWKKTSYPPSSVTFSDGNTGVSVNSRRAEPNTTAVIISWRTRPIDRVLVHVFPGGK